MKRDVIKGRWTRALAGTGICPICHCPDKPWHVPSLCPMLKELHLKINVLPGPPPAPLLLWLHLRALHQAVASLQLMIRRSAVLRRLVQRQPLPAWSLQCCHRSMSLMSMNLMKTSAGLATKAVWITVMSLLLNLSRPLLVICPRPIMRSSCLLRVLRLLQSLAFLFRKIS